MTERRARPEAAAAALAPQGPGKFLLALFLTALPLIAAPILLAKREDLKGSPIEKLGSIFAKGFVALDARLFAAEEPEKPPPPAPKPAPAPAPEEVKPGPEEKANWEKEITKLIEQTNRRKRDLKTAAVGATPEQKAAMAEVQAEQDRQLKQLAELQKTYKKYFGKEYDPEKQ
jgi:hypothetical protein